LNLLFSLKECDLMDKNKIIGVSIAILLFGIIVLSGMGIIYN